MVLVTGVVLVNNSTFGGKVLLENLAYDIALSVRQAQVYGIAVQRYGSTVSGFDVGYGTHFRTASADTYVLFGDGVTANGLFDAGEAVETTSIRNGFRIFGLCATPALGGSELCGLDEVNIFFKRPDPDAWISALDLPAAATSCILNGTSQCYSQVRVIVRSPRGDQSSVVIDANGQITVVKIP
jgi:hypothetical protein